MAVSAIALNYKSMTPTELANFLRRVATGIGNDRRLAACPVSAADLNAAADAIVASEKAHQDSDKVAHDTTATFHARVADGHEKGRRAAQFVESILGTDQASIKATGFELAAAREKAGVLPPPTGMAATAGDHPGAVDAMCDPHRKPKPKGYQWEYALDPSKEENFKFAAHSTRSRIAFVLAGLASGTKVWVRVHAITSEGASGASQPAMVILP